MTSEVKDTLPPRSKFSAVRHTLEKHHRSLFRFRSGHSTGQGQGPVDRQAASLDPPKFLIPQTSPVQNLLETSMEDAVLRSAKRAGRPRRHARRARPRCRTGPPPTRTRRAPVTAAGATGPREVFNHYLILDFSSFHF